MCLIESGKQPAKYVIKKRLKTFLEKKMSNRDMEEPFQIAFEMCKNLNTPGYKFLKKAIDESNDSNSLEKIVQVIRRKDDATKFVTYRTELKVSMLGLWYISVWFLDLNNLFNFYIWYLFIINKW